MAGESPAVVLFDVNGNRVEVPVDGLRSLAVRDEEQLELLRDIHSEILKLNTYMSMILDHRLTEVREEA